MVTGGVGFIGSHLCERLLKESNKVICLYDYFTGNKQNINNLKYNSNFEVVEHGICEPHFAEVDEIYHLACPASPVHYQILLFLHCSFMQAKAGHEWSNKTSEITLNRTP